MTQVAIVNNKTTVTPGAKSVQIVTVGTQGPAGVAGADGASPDQVIKTASVDLNGHRAVAVSGAGLVYADSSNQAHIGLVIGITTGAVLAGQSVNVLTAGEVTEPTWSWSLGNVYVGVNGLLTQTAPTVGFIQIIGIATSPTTLLVAPKISFLI